VLLDLLLHCRCLVLDYMCHLIHWCISLCNPESVSGKHKQWMPDNADNTSIVEPICQMTQLSTRECMLYFQNCKIISKSLGTRNTNNQQKMVHNISNKQKQRSRYHEITNSSTISGRCLLKTLLILACSTIHDALLHTVYQAKHIF